MSFDPAWSGLFKNATITGLRFVPEVGAPQSALVSLLWPPDNGAPLAQLEAYVDQRMGKVLDKVKVDELHTTIEGLKNNMLILVDAESPNKHKAAMQFLLLNTANTQSLFFPDNDDQPWATMTYRVAFGTIRLGLLRQEWLHYEGKWGDPDSNPAQTLANLNTQITNFAHLVKKGRDYGMDWRQSCIALTESRDGWTLTDTQDPSVHTTWSTTYGGGGHPAALIGLGNFMYDVTLDSDRFGSKLDKLVEASQVWKFYSSETEFTLDLLGPNYWHNRFGNAQVVPLTANGNRIDPAYISWNDEHMYLTHGPISRVPIYHDSDETNGQINGLEIWYGGVSSGLHGAATGTQQDVTSESGEWIQSMGMR